MTSTAASAAPVPRVASEPRRRPYGLLLVAAPVPPATLRRAKLLAALIPVWGIFVPVAVALVALDVVAAGVAVLVILITTVAVAFSRLQSPRRARRQDLFNRYRG